MSSDYRNWNKLYAATNIEHTDSVYPEAGKLVKFVLNAGSIQFERFGIVTISTLPHKEENRDKYKAIIEFKRGIESRKLHVLPEVEFWQELGSVKEIPPGVFNDIQLAEVVRYWRDLNVFPKDTSEEDFFNGNAKPLPVLHPNAKGNVR